MSTKTRKYEQKARAEGRQQTRTRITKAASELHAEVGPAATTVAEIARRAGVTRLTVYNHFPDNAALYPACSAHWLSEHPLPDFQSALAIEDPGERVRAVLVLLYGELYGKSGQMLGNLQRDRGADPALEEFMSQNTDALLDTLASRLAEAFGVGSSARGARLRSLIRLALDYWTWRRLGAEGLSDADAAALMADAVEAAAGST